MSITGHQVAAKTAVSTNDTAVVAPVATPIVAGAFAKVSSIVPRVERALRRVDYRVPIGGTLVALAASFALFANMPQHQSIVELQHQAMTQHGTVTHAVTDAAQPSTAFLADLPSRAEIPQVLSQIYQQASDAGVEIARGNYELTMMRSGSLARYQFTFPLKAPYPRIRTFIDKTLLTVPAAAIDSLRLERKNIGDESVNAELRFTVFVKNAS